MRRGIVETVGEGKVALMEPVAVRNSSSATVVVLIVILQNSRSRNKKWYVRFLVEGGEEVGEDPPQAVRSPPPLLAPRSVRP